MHSTARKQLTLAAALMTLMQAPALAQQRNGPLEEIIVSSSRIPLPLRRTGTSVTLMTAEDIDAHGNLSLPDVLRQMPAVSVSGNGGAGKATALRIRGEEGFRTLMLLDGIRLSDPSGPQVSPPLEHVLSSGIGRVEVLRGPQGLGYGADAGGIVNVNTRQVTEGTLVNLDAQHGSFGTRQYGAQVGGGNERADYFLSATDFAMEGFNILAADSVLRDDDGYRNTTLHGRGGIGLGENLRLEAVHHDVDGEALTDGCFHPLTFAPEHDCAAHFDLAASRMALTHTDDRLTHSLAYATTRTDRDSVDLGVATFSTRGELRRWEYLGSATALPGFDLVFGADREEALNNGTGRVNTGVHAEYLSDFAGALFVSAGLRHDRNEDFGSHTTWRLSGAYQIETGTTGTLRFRSSYGTGFRAPSPYEIAYNAGPFGAPPATLAALRQETSRGFEAGMEYLHADRLRLGMVYFDQRVADAIQFDLAGFSGYLQEFGASSSRGVELAGEAAVGDNWRLVANYTWNRTARPDGRQRVRRPEHLLNLGLSWSGLRNRLHLNAFLRAAHSAIDEVGTSVLAVDDFAVLDLSATADLGATLQVYARVENALDERYQETIGYNTAGLAAYVGFRLNYRNP